MQFQVAEKHAGKRGKCPSCKQTVLIEPRQIDDDDVTYEVAAADVEPQFTVCAHCQASMPETATLCTKCGYDASTGRLMGAVARANSPQVIEKPHELDVERTEDSLLIRTRGVANLMLVSYACCAIFCFFGLAALRINFGMLGSPILSVLVIGPIAYLLAGMFLNRVVVEVNHEGVRIHTEGPVPWPNMKTFVGKDDIHQFYVVQRKVDSEHGPSINYDIYALLTNGWRRKLYSTPILKTANYVERNIERFLGIEEFPVVSSTYQKTFLGESTRYDDVSPASAVRAKSFAVPTSGVMLYVTICVVPFFLMAISSCGLGLLGLVLSLVSPKSSRPPENQSTSVSSDSSLPVQDATPKTKQAEEDSPVTADKSSVAREGAREAEQPTVGSKSFSQWLDGARYSQLFNRKS